MYQLDHEKIIRKFFGSARANIFLARLSSCRYFQKCILAWLETGKNWLDPRLHCAVCTIPNFVQNIYSGHCVLRLLCVLVLKRDFLSELFTTIGQCQLVWFPFAWSLFKDSSSWQKVLLFFTVSFIFDCCQVSRIMYRLRCIIILPSEI